MSTEEKQKKSAKQEAHEQRLRDVYQQKELRKEAKRQAHLAHQANQKAASAEKALQRALDPSAPPTKPQQPKKPKQPKQPVKTEAEILEARQAKEAKKEANRIRAQELREAAIKKRAEKKAAAEARAARDEELRNTKADRQVRVKLDWAAFQAAFMEQASQFGEVKKNELAARLPAAVFVEFTDAQAANKMRKSLKSSSLDVSVGIKALAKPVPDKAVNFYPSEGKATVEDVKKAFGKIAKVQSVVSQWGLFIVTFSSKKGMESAIAKSAEAEAAGTALTLPGLECGFSPLCRGLPTSTRQRLQQKRKRKSVESNAKKAKSS